MRVAGVPALGTGRLRRNATSRIHLAATASAAVRCLLFARTAAMEAEASVSGGGIARGTAPTPAETRRLPLCSRSLTSNRPVR